MRRVLSAVLSLAALVAPASAFVVGYGGASTPSVQAASASSTTALVDTRAQAIDQARATAVREQKPAPLTLTFNEADLRPAIKRLPTALPFGLTLEQRDLRLLAGDLLLRGKLGLPAGDGELSLVVRPVATHGRLGLQMVDARVFGGLALPGMVTDPLLLELEAAFARSIPTDFTVTRVAVGGGALVVSGVVSPPTAAKP